MSLRAKRKGTPLENCPVKDLPSKHLDPTKEVIGGRMGVHEVWRW
jgi:hypothetical protein